MAKLTQDDLRKMTPEKRKAYENQKRRIERNRKILGMFVCAFLVIATVAVLSLTVFFRIDTIVIKGNSKYDENQIINASGITKGDNLLVCNLQKASEGICKNLTYISKAEVKRELPSSIIFEITPAEAYIAAKATSGIALIDKNGKILEIVAEDKVPKNVIMLEAGAVFTKSLGENIFELKDEDNTQKDESQKVKNLKIVFDAISASKLSGITEINIKSSSSVFITYQNRLKLNLGTMDDMEYKLKSAVEIIKKENEIDPNEKGEIFLSNPDKVYVSPEKNN